MNCYDLDELLRELRRRGWLLNFFGPRDDLKAIGAIQAWDTCADVLILRGEHDASAFRMPTFSDTDHFAPTLVCWQYHATAIWTLRAVLTLEKPGHPGAPTAVLRPSAGCFIPDEIRRPVTIRATRGWT